MRRLTMLAAWLALAVPVLAQPPARALPPPVGEERVRMLEGIRASYPTIPDRLAQIMADERRRLTDSSHCDLLQWLADPASGAAQNVRQVAQRYGSRCAPPTRLTADAVRAKLKDRAFAFEVTGDTLLILARSDQDVSVCCSQQVRLRRIGDSDLWGGEIKLKSPEEAILSLSVNGPPGRARAEMVWRGPKAPPPPAKKPVAGLKGQRLQPELKSAALQETRKLSIYLPPGWTRDRRWPALFLADGAAAAYAPLVEALIDSGRIRPIVLVSADTGPNAIVGPTTQKYGDMLRQAEYVRGFLLSADDGRFEKHMTFFTGELVDYAVGEFGVTRRAEDLAVAGFSNGADFAAVAGLLHPEVFGSTIVMSPAAVGIAPSDLRASPRSRFWVSGGLYEPSFEYTARNVEAALKAAGYQVQGRYLAAGHSNDQWEVVLHDALLEIFSITAASARPRAATN